MKMKSNAVHYGYFEKFDGGPTLLFMGGASIASLLELFEEIAASPVGTRIDLSEKANFAAKKNTSVVISVTPSPSVNIRILGHKPGHEISLGVTAEMASHFATLTEIVVASSFPCHHYLDICANCDLTVLVSKNEYDEETFRWED